jgi:hypothetical protein
VHVAAAETRTAKDLPRIGGVAGSDFMVDVIKTLDIKYLPENPASSFRGLHESLIITHFRAAFWKSHLAEFMKTLPPEM